MFVKTKNNGLINLNNVEHIFIDETDYYFFIVARVETREFNLAKYDTIEEAKDKFENIIIGLKEKWEVLEL